MTDGVLLECMLLRRSGDDWETPSEPRLKAEVQWFKKDVD